MIYLSNKNLTKDQVYNLNNILFNLQRRWSQRKVRKRSTAPSTKIIALNKVESVYELISKSYLDFAIISFKFNTKTTTKICDLDGDWVINNYAGMDDLTTSLNGVIYINDNKLMFKKTRETKAEIFRATVFLSKAQLSSEN